MCFPYKVFDGAANLWRKVVVDSIKVRWVDLGTRLLLRHVVYPRELSGDADTDYDPDDRPIDDQHQNEGVSHRYCGTGGSLMCVSTKRYAKEIYALSQGSRTVVSSATAGCAVHDALIPHLPSQLI